MVMVPGVHKHNRTGSVWPVPMVKVVRSLPAVQDCRCRRTHSHAPGTVPAVRFFRTSRPPLIACSIFLTEGTPLSRSNVSESHQ